jgi:hypothetical protein
MKATFEFTEQQYHEFETFLRDLNKENWGTWNPSEWLRYPGLPGYSIQQYEQTNGKTFVVVKFDEAVKLPDNRKGKKFKVGGDRNYQPVCDRF